MPEAGGPPQGASSATINAMLQASSAGQTAGAQQWLFSWLGPLDHKPGLTPIQEMLQFHANKKIVPGIEACKFLPVMSSGFLAKIFGEIFGAGLQLEDWAQDLSPEQIEAIMAARASGIEAEDGNYRGMLGALSSMSNVAMNQASGPELA